jgi:hypothetical protein
MPTYYFHIDGPRPYADLTGAILPDDESAWEQARRTVRDIEDHLQPGEEWRLEVAHGSRAVFLLTVSSRRV